VTTCGPRNPERTRGNLLQAGITLFARHGFHGVSVDEVVTQAGCNKRMLYHYFGDKEGLYVAALQTVYARLEQVEMAPLPPETSTAGVICAVMQRHFDFLAQDHEFVKLLLWENLNEGKLLARHPHLLTKAPILNQLGSLLEAARRKGEITASGDVRHLLVLMIGMCFIHFSNQHTLRQAINLDLTQPETLAEGLQLAQQMFLAYLGLVPPKPGLVPPKLGLIPPK
jgi:AcrR family transcriptional regulator